ncbi:hypothetical protein B9Z55_007987 [Caenorhabditis nigoni]|uniref:EGF-like domain-containing protein n=2 Tax=Caenorhabditis nigoni TaxID=1611254 RepID=A0A2G5VC62_9PELO|nr:hypothetical protein B9Z55_007987 [Caenorhabditis nigoni]
MAIISVRTELHMCSKSCGFRGICYEASGTFLCRCPRGFIGDECDTLVNQLTLEPIGFGYWPWDLTLGLLYIALLLSLIAFFVVNRQGDNDQDIDKKSLSELKIPVETDNDKSLLIVDDQI